MNCSAVGYHLDVEGDPITVFIALSAVYGWFALIMAAYNFWGRKARDRRRGEAALGKFTQALAQNEGLVDGAAKQIPRAH
jgi:hypothetical protein